MQVETEALLEMGLPVSGTQFVELMRDPFSEGRRMVYPPSHFPHVSHVSLKVGWKENKDLLLLVCVPSQYQVGD